MSDQVSEKLSEAQERAEAAKEAGLSPEKAAAYWKRNMTVIGVLLVIWALVSYVFGFLLAQPTQDINIGSVPFGFWWAQQGAMVVFVLLILAYAVIMDRVDQEFGVNE